ncbi:MAG TPA: 2-oxoacid:acceptor oxidoreductase family protein [Victivallales bacterium]|nr:2-oxoacid:acceptor oxidoreductase family protein [Victivallales bacterium]
MDKYKMIFSGSGGQGVITAAIILAEAAVLHEDLFAVQSQSYGPEARGGSTRSDVIISSSKINYPKVMNPSVLVCLTQESYRKFSHLIIPGGTVITDSRFVTPGKTSDAILKELDMYDAVMEKIGNPIVLNMCMLGAVIHITQIIKPASLFKIIEARMPGKFVEMNKEAIEIGIGLASK